jgi:hypothetical protein
MVCRVQENQKTLCHERDAQDKNHWQKKYPFGYELTVAALSLKTSIYRKYELCFSRQGDFVFSNGPVDRWRLEISHGL